MRGSSRLQATPPASRVSRNESTKRDLRQNRPDAARSERYAQANPIELLPLGVPLRLVHGALDPIVPLEQSQRFVAHARAKGDDASAVIIDVAGHFDLIAPFSPAWGTVEKTVLSLLAR